MQGLTWRDWESEYRFGDKKLDYISADAYEKCRRCNYRKICQFSYGIGYDSRSCELESSYKQEILQYSFIEIYSVE